MTTMTDWARKLDDYLVINDYEDIDDIVKKQSKVPECVWDIRPLRSEIRIAWFGRF